MDAKLIVVRGAAPIEIELFLPFLIGRAADAALKIPHDSVSREHCRIYEFDGELAVRDLGSRNGTYVNGQRIDRPTFLSPGDELTVGDITLRADYQIRRQVVLVPHDEADPGQRREKTSAAETSLPEATVHEAGQAAEPAAQKTQRRVDRQAAATQAADAARQSRRRAGGQQPPAKDQPLPQAAETPTVEALPDLGLPAAPLIDQVELEMDEAPPPVGEAQLRDFLDGLDER